MMRPHSALGNQAPTVYVHKLWHAEGSQNVWSYFW